MNQELEKKAQSHDPKSNTVWTLRFHSAQERIDKRGGVKDAIELIEVVKQDCTFSSEGQSPTKRLEFMKSLDGSVGQDARWTNFQNAIDNTKAALVDKIICFGMPTIKSSSVNEFNISAYANHIFIGQVSARLKNPEAYFHCPPEIISKTDTDARKRAIRAGAGSDANVPRILKTLGTYPSLKEMTPKSLVMSFTPNWCVRQVLAEIPAISLPRFIICDTVNVGENSWFEFTDGGTTLEDPSAPKVQEVFTKYYDCHILGNDQYVKKESIGFGCPDYTELSLYIRKDNHTSL